MKTFDYLVADSLDAALAEYANGKSLLKAGGIDLIDRMKERLETPGSVLSIGNVGDLAYIREEGQGLRIGSLTSLADMGRSELLNRKYPGLAYCARHTATAQIRERATLGGNLCQKPRCWYFRLKEFNCLRKNGHTCFAVEGENQYHAIFGGGPCHIVHPSNCAIPLLATDAQLKVKSQNGERTVMARDFFVGPRESLTREHVLRDDEIVYEVRIPQAPSESATLELREKQSFDWPLVIASVARISGKWNVCLGAVAPIPWISEPAMAVLGNKEISQALAEKAAAAAAQGASPLSHNTYKVQMVKVAVKRTLMVAAGMEVPNEY
jgi:xanthine dehydrogenase YagS FAD-binding subunit